MSHTLYKCLLYCRSPTSQGPHSFQGYNTHKQHQERNEQSGEVSSSAVNHAVLPDTNVTSDLSSLKAFRLANQSREPAFDSVGVSKLCSLGWAVSVSEPWAQQHFLTAVQCSFCLPAACWQATLEAHSCPYMQLSCPSFPPVWRTLPMLLGFFAYRRSSMVKTERSKGRRRVEQEMEERKKPR